jgi:hypothetical protein
MEIPSIAYDRYIAGTMPKVGQFRENIFHEAIQAREWSCLGHGFRGSGRVSGTVSL